MSRITSVRENLKGTEDPDDLMIDIISALDEGDKVPSPGKFYVFVYNPKTPNIRYDQNPLVAVTDIFEWGFRGINFHWGQSRQYTWQEVVGSLHIVNSDELQDLISIPYGKIELNN